MRRDPSGGVSVKMPATVPPRIQIPTLPPAGLTLPKQLEGLQRLAYNHYWMWHPRVRVLFRRIDAQSWLRYRNPVPLIQGNQNWSGDPRRHRPDGRVQDAARRLRQVHGERLRPLVRAQPRRPAGRADRLLLRRVRAQRVARHLLGRPGRARRRPPEGRLGHGHPVRRGRPFLSPRLLPPDHRRRRPPGARLPRLRPGPAAAPARRRSPTAGRSAWRSSCPAGTVWVRGLAGPGRPRAAAAARHGHPGQRRGGPADHPHPLRPRPRDAAAPGDRAGRRRRTRA